MPVPKASQSKTFFFFAAAWIAKRLYQLYFRTICLRVVNGQYENLRGRSADVVYACWHAKTFLLLPHIQGWSVAVLTLLDWKNFFYDKLCLLYGCKTVPTTDSAMSTLKLIRYLRDGTSVLLAVDGPKGPRGVVRPGAAYLSKKTAKPIVTIQVNVEKSFRLKDRWDYYEIPFPFSIATITFSEPFHVTDDNKDHVPLWMAQTLGEF